MRVEKQISIQAGEIPPKSLFERLIELWKSLSVLQQVSLVVGTSVVVVVGVKASRSSKVVVLKE